MKLYGDTSRRRERIQELLDEIDDDADELTDWERDEFMPSVREQFEERGSLSDLQFGLLEEIAGKC